MRFWKRTKSRRRLAKGNTTVEMMKEGARSPTDRSEVVKIGEPGGAEEANTQGDAEGLEGQRGAAGTHDQGGDMGLADLNRVGN